MDHDHDPLCVYSCASTSCATVCHRVARCFILHVGEVPKKKEGVGMKTCSVIFPPGSVCTAGYFQAFGHLLGFWALTQTVLYSARLTRLTPLRRKNETSAWSIENSSGGLLTQCRALRPSRKSNSQLINLNSPIYLSAVLIQRGYFYCNFSHQRL